MAKKVERLYLRTTPYNKAFLQRLSDELTEGNMNALLDKLIEELKDDFPEIVKEVNSDGGTT